MSNPALSALPRVDRVLAHPLVAAAIERMGVALVTRLVRAEIDAARRELLAHEREAAPLEGDVASDVACKAAGLGRSRTRRVINATGVILHTNLGRAPLADEARAAVSETMAGYASLELDLETGKRGGRAAFAEAALAALSGAESALVVNNCAAAVLLVLASEAAGKRVVVSRGELVEIGGSFRVPDILRQSGCELVEVGTTNRTRIADYERALDSGPVGAILRVHQGNFRMTGFVERPELTELAALSRARGVPLVKDLGGGALVELTEIGVEGGSRGFSGEPTVGGSVRGGADLVCFSGDKVLGGPQAGIVLGRAEHVERARKHPLARALRLGRLPLVALEATLALYLRGEASSVPVLHAIERSLHDVGARAARWAETAARAGHDVRVVDTEVEMGGGALADRTIASRGMAVKCSDGADALAARLRAGEPAVVGRVVDDLLVLDARTVLDGEDDALLEALLRALTAG